MLRQLPWLALWLTACASDDPEPAPPAPEPTPTADTQTTPAPTADTAPPPFDELVWTDAHTQPIAAPATLAVHSGADAQSVRVHWENLTTDAWGEPLDPAVITSVALAEVQVEDIPAAEALVAARGLSPSAVIEWWVAGVPARDEVTMGEFTARGGTFSGPAYFTTSNPRGWLLLLLDADGEMKQAARLEPVAGASASVEITNQSLDASLALGAMAPALPMPSDFVGNLTIKELQTDSFGSPLVDDLVDGAFLQPAGADPASIDLRRLGRPAGDTFRTSFSPGAIDIALADFANDDGPFQGIGDQTWLLGLTCSTCTHHVPVAIAWVAPR